MRKFLISTGAAALLAVSSVGAFAIDTEANGKIAAIGDGTLTLESGATFTLAPTVSAMNLSVGEDVIVSYDQDTMEAHLVRSQMSVVGPNTERLNPNVELD